MDKKRLQILVSAVNKNAAKLPEMMNIESDAVIVNQIIGEAGQEFVNVPSELEEVIYENNIRILNRHEKGVGLSRNTAFNISDHEIIQFADDDIV